MYEAYWQLERKPFQGETISDWYYPTEGHQGALLKLRYALDCGGSALLAGPSGVGKTMVIELLKAQLEPSAGPIVHVVFPPLEPAGLLNWIADDLDTSAADRQDRGGSDRALRRIRDRLEALVHRGQHTVVAIDEGHRLDPLTFELLRQLLNFTVAGRPALSLVLIGQPSLLPQLQRVIDLDQRLAVRCLLRPLTVDETASYVSHQLTVAGSSSAIFAPDAIETVHHLAQGLPRQINRLCDLAMLVGYAEDSASITVEHFERVARELVAVAN